MSSDAQRARALDELLDREEIRQCLTRYTRGIDRHDTALAASAYHAGAIDDHTDYIGPGESFPDWANAAHDGYWEAHQHYIANTTIDLDGDTAHVETYWLVVGRRKNNAGTDMHGGRYVDRFEKRNRKWGIADRVCVYEWGLRSEEAVQQLASFPLGTQDRSDISYERPLEVRRKRTV